MEIPEDNDFENELDEEEQEIEEEKKEAKEIKAKKAVGKTAPVKAEAVKERYAYICGG